MHIVTVEMHIVTVEKHIVTFEKHIKGVEMHDCKTSILKVFIFASNQM
jgi:hypothetical protein